VRTAALVVFIQSVGKLKSNNTIKNQVFQRVLIDKVKMFKGADTYKFQYYFY